MAGRFRTSPARTIAVLVAIAALAGGCELGGGDDLDSVYDDATLEVDTEVQVADGITEVGVSLTGPVGATLSLGVQGAGARFVNADPGTPGEKTVFLEDGTATVAATGTTPGEARIAFVPKPVQSARFVEFVPVRMAAGEPSPIAFQPGFVVHELCIAVNSAFGAVDVGGVALDVSDVPPPGLTCPTEAVDAIGWTGWVRALFSTESALADLPATYMSEDGAALRMVVFNLTATSFAGYDVAATAPMESGGVVSFDVALTFRAAGTLDAAPADGVTLADLRFVFPGGGAAPVFLGSSSGDAGEAPVTGDDGTVTLLYDVSSTPPGTFTLFGTPAGGSPAFITDIVIE